LAIGVELDGPFGSDRRLLAIGLAFERVLDSERAGSLTAFAPGETLRGRAGATSRIVAVHTLPSSMAQSRRAEKAPPPTAARPGQRILKKYPNRRLYDTEVSSYITLADVKAMVLKGTAFEVRDAKTGADLTRSILLQIILEEETGGVPIFSTSTLAHIIRFYGNAMQGMMGSYIEQNLQTFADVQARLAEQSKGLYDPRLQSPEMWTKFLSGQAPMVQNLMGSYLEQSRKIFMQMQEQLSKQAETLFPGVAARNAPPKR